MKKSENELQKAIKALMDYYGMPEYPQDFQDPMKPIYIIDVLYFMLYMGLDGICLLYRLKVESDELRAERTEIRELAQLKKFLRSLRDYDDRELTFRHTKSKKSFTLSDDAGFYFLDEFELFINNYLSTIYNDFKEAQAQVKEIQAKAVKGFDHSSAYSLIDFILSSRSPVRESKEIFDKSESESNDMFPTCQELLNFSLYTDEDLDKIIEATKSPRDKIRLDKNRNAMLGCFASIALEIIDPVTPNNFTKTKLYSFVYDIMAIGEIVVDRGEGFSGDIAREKLQDVRHWLDAFQELKKKF